MAEVVLSNIDKSYPRNNSAVSNLNLTVKDKEFVVLAGPAGSGKSTVLRMIAGLEQPSNGTIQIDGRIVNDSSPKDRDVAMVFRNPALYQHMTACNNIAFSLKLRKLSRDAIEQRVKNTAELLRITDILGRRPKELNPEQSMRVALARAIAKKPALLLLDDPLAGLDSQIRIELHEEIRRLHYLLATTIIYAAEDPAEAMITADRIAVLYGGSLQQAADPLTLYNSPANRFVAEFPGFPPINLFDGKISYDSGRILFEQGSFSLPLPDLFVNAMQNYSGKTVVLGIRPEDITPESAASHSAESIQGRVEAIEVKGPVTHLHLTTLNTSFIARIPSRHPHRIGDSIRLQINMMKAHFFDRKTGKSIIPDSARLTGV